VILMRHGQSHFNLHYGMTHRDPGLRDPGLTELGRQQVAAAAEILRRHEVRGIVASPYTRTLETAEIVADTLRLDVTVDPCVGEQAVFTCDIGTPRAALAARWPRLALDHIPDEWWPAPTETETSLIGRCQTFRNRMAEAGGWRGIVVVTHYHVIRTLTGQVLPNAGLVRFDPSSAHPNGGAVVPLSDPC
jgi:broad specificity phosphatase PhoE